MLKYKENKNKIIILVAMVTFRMLMDLKSIFNILKEY